MIVFKGIPVPPSSNDQYATMIVKGRPIRFPSKSAKEYKKAFGIWAIKNNAALKEAREIIVKWNSPLEVSMFVALDKSRIFCKDGRLKKLDVTNRSKSLHDLLSDHIGIDDSYFISTPMEKVIADSDEQVIVVIKPKLVRHLLTIQQDLKG